ncbi:MAG: hypothetical protein ACFFD1_00950 [Candidatus Thorarchaeota archaeon]
MKTYRQGDVLLVEINKLPKNLKEKDKTIAYGEITGHHHRFKSKQVQVFVDDENQQFVQIKKPSKLVHEEHSELEIPKGDFKVILQREYDILEENIRQVLD